MIEDCSAGIPKIGVDELSRYYSMSVEGLSWNSSGLHYIERLFVHVRLARWVYD